MQDISSSNIVLELEIRIELVSTLNGAPGQRQI